VPAGTVLRVLQAGYRLGERLIRPAQVGVAKGGPSTAAARLATNNGDDNGEPDSDDSGQHVDTSV